jgi:hypothetical protein
MKLAGALQILVLRNFSSSLFIAVMLQMLWCAAATAEGPVPAARHAIIVGVSGYTGPIDPLPGVKNDVTLLVNTLLDQGVPRENIRVLADDLNNAFYDRKVKSDGTPTLEQILEGLEWLSMKAKSGDHVIVYF